LTVPPPAVDAVVLGAQALEAVTARQIQQTPAPDVAVDERSGELLVALVGEVSVPGECRRESVAHAAAELQLLGEREELKDRDPRAG
jgi:hypothetical protein